MSAAFVVALATVFRFEHIPPATGIRRIHSPEHIAATHPLTLPNFKIVPGSASRPVVHQGVALVAFDFEVGIMPRRYSARLLSSPGKSDVFVMDAAASPCFYAKLAVEPLDTAGHALTVDVLAYAQANWAKTMLANAWAACWAWEWGVCPRDMSF